MSAVLHSITDPRGPLEKARRLELFRFAREHGLGDIVETMPAELMRTILRSKGITSIAVPDRQLGGMQQEFTTPTSHKGGGVASSPRQPDQPVAEVDAVADLARQWQQQQRAKPARPVAEMNITELRKECKQRGIKMVRRDNMDTLKAKLNG